LFETAWILAVTIFLENSADFFKIMFSCF